MQILTELFVQCPQWLIQLKCVVLSGFCHIDHQNSTWILIFIYILNIHMGQRGYKEGEWQMVSIKYTYGTERLQGRRVTDGQY